MKEEEEKVVEKRTEREHREAAEKREREGDRKREQKRKSRKRKKKKKRHLSKWRWWSSRNTLDRDQLSANLLKSRFRAQQGGKSDVPYQQNTCP